MMMMFQIFKHKFQQRQQHHYLPTTLFVAIAAHGLHVTTATPIARCYTHCLLPLLHLAIRRFRVI
jgi:hypothetical protein